MSAAELQPWCAEVDAEGEPRVRDVDLAQRAGMANARDIRSHIKTHREELEEHGALVVRRQRRRTQMPGGNAFREVEVDEFWLNESQACALVMLLRTPKARELRVAVVRAFMAARSFDPKVPGAQLMARMLRFQAAKSSRKLWQEEIVASLCQTYGITRTAKGLPAPLMGVIGWIYRVVLTPEVYAEMKARNPRGADRDLHYEWWTDELRGLLDDDVNVIRALSSTSSGKADFKRRLLAHYRREPLQLGISGAAE